MSDERAKWIEGLRELASFLEGNPDLPLPQAFYGLVWSSSKDCTFNLAKGRGPWHKYFSGSYAYLSRRFGPHEYSFGLTRDLVCERIVTGTREVPASPARIEEIVEWKCGPFFEGI